MHTVAAIETSMVTRQQVAFVAITGQGIEQDGSVTATKCVKPNVNKTIKQLNYEMPKLFNFNNFSENDVIIVPRTTTSKSIIDAEVQSRIKVDFWEFGPLLII